MTTLPPEERIVRLTAALRLTMARLPAPTTAADRTLRNELQAALDGAGEAELVHLIVTRGDSTVGMDEIVRRVHKALDGRLIELRDVAGGESSSPGMEGGTPPMPATPPPPVSPYPYPAKVTGSKGANVRDASGKFLRLLARGAAVEVWGERQALSGRTELGWVKVAPFKDEWAWKELVTRT